MQQQPAKPSQIPTAADIGGQSVRLTFQDARGLRVRLQDLRSELQDAAERRNSIASRLKDADPSARAGYEQRLGVLDQRIVAIEKEITATGEQLRSIPASELAQPGFPNQMDFPMDPGDIVPIVGILSVFVFFPIALAMSRYLWRRASAPPRPALSDQATQQRLEQLQQAVDTIAIEVERISEGQRFVTKILSERDRVALGAGGAEPVRTAKKAAIPTQRG